MKITLSRNGLYTDERSLFTSSHCFFSFFASNSRTALLRSFRFFDKLDFTCSQLTQNGPIIRFEGMASPIFFFSSKCFSTSLLTSAGV